MCAFHGSLSGRSPAVAECLSCVGGQLSQDSTVMENLGWGWKGWLFWLQDCRRQSVAGER